MLNIIKETPKALKLETPEGVEFWIQRRWMRANGSLTPAGDAARIKAEDEAAESENLVTMPISWQNEKSIGIDYRAAFTLSSSVDARDRRVRAFVAKSAVEIDGDTARLPVWLERKARNEAMQREIKKGLHEGYTIVAAWDA